MGHRDTTTGSAKFPGKAKGKSKAKCTKATEPKSGQTEMAKLVTQNTLANLEKKTQACIQKGVGTSGVRFIDAGKRFQLDWKKGVMRGKVTVPAENKRDEAACKTAHLKFHAVAAALA